jgi:hypothetical protein
MLRDMRAISTVIQRSSDSGLSRVHQLVMEFGVPHYG